ncbi:hypothetical protein [Streptomyces sp. PRh5]|uniref:hypothetical protein n=1 Tax=Streptomyces sp. PRh5 TaxID=1158056 RepID=UPI0004B84F94|nr:hypothetical protein [Streptomyces sp. PRh5]
MHPTYHWLVTIQWTAEDGTTTALTGSGTIEPGSKATRENLTLDVINHTRKQAGLDDDTTVAVLFLSLEPNELKKLKKQKGDRS